jgi:hypothetical protein
MALLGVIGSLGLSAVLWIVFGSPVFFLFVPFVPFVLGRGRANDRQRTYQCPTCGFRTTDSRYQYCPRDGTRLRNE